MHTKRSKAALRATILLLPLAALSLTGCGKKTIVGTWTTGGPPWMGITDTFREDGTETISVAGDIAPGQHLNMQTNGTYKYTDGTLTRKTADISVGGTRTPVPPGTSDQTFAVTLEGDTLKMPAQSAVPVPGIVPQSPGGVPLVYKRRN